MDFAGGRLVESGRPLVEQINATVLDAMRLPLHDLRLCLLIHSLLVEVDHVRADLCVAFLRGARSHVRERFLFLLFREHVALYELLLQVVFHFEHGVHFHDRRSGWTERRLFFVVRKRRVGGGRVLRGEVLLRLVHAKGGFRLPAPFRT